MDHTCKNRSHVENRSHLEKWITHGKVGHTWKNGSHVEKLVTLGKMVHT